jgi:hypothetical protein
MTACSIGWPGYSRTSSNCSSKWLCSAHAARQQVFARCHLDAPVHLFIGLLLLLFLMYLLLLLAAAAGRCCWQAFKAQMGDKAAGVNDDLLKMLSGTQMVRDTSGAAGFSRCNHSNGAAADCHGALACRFDAGSAGMAVLAHHAHGRLSVGC